MKRTILIAVILATVVATGCGVAPERYQGILPVQSISGDIGGTGFVFYRTVDYYFIGTAAHVVTDIENVVVGDMPGVVVARDPASDVAILRVSTAGHDYRIYKFGEAVMEGAVRAVGYSWSDCLACPPSLMVYHGRVTCLNFSQDITANTGCYPGLSGGPLLDESGRVVGITSRAAMARGHPLEMTSIFVPVARLQELWDRIKDREINDG